MCVCVWDPPLQEDCPASIEFVLKETDPENWLSDGGVDFNITLKPPKVEALIEKVRLFGIMGMDLGVVALCV